MSKPMMKIGVDFDNTIVCYDRLFYRLAVERDLIPPHAPAQKQAIRDYLRAAKNEIAWTELQGLAYGARIGEAAPFAGVKEFFQRCRRQQVDVCIISHKTKTPFQGPAFDLHQAASGWLEQHGFFAAGEIGLAREQVFFEQTKEEKLARIARRQCSHFIDDLPEFLLAAGFPPQVERILFDPGNRGEACDVLRRLASWEEIQAALIPGAKP